MLIILNQVDFDLTNIDPELVHTMWSLALESLNEVRPSNIVFVLSSKKYSYGTFLANIYFLVGVKFSEGSDEAEDFRICLLVHISIVLLPCHCTICIEYFKVIKVNGHSD